MEGLYDNQAELYDSVSKLLVNIKKDGAERKTIEYCQQRLERLEALWSKFKLNHLKLERVGVSSDPYFERNEYDQMRELYSTAKELLQQTYGELVKKEQLLREEQQVEQAASKKAGVEQPKAGPSRQADEVTRQAKKVRGHQQVQLEEESTDVSYHRITSRGTYSKLDDMLKKQSINFKAFQRCVNNINIELFENKWEFEDALKMLQSRWTAIDNLHWEIAGEVDGEEIEYEREYNRHENQFNSIKKEINTKLWSVSHREKSTPQMDIPSFSGSYQQWVSFKDLFNEAIHNNPSLSNAQKMQFLKSKLTGEAERIIHHLQISSDNYVVCWEILNHRFNNKRLIFTSHLNTLLNLPIMQQQSLGQIKRLHDVTKESLHAIQNLGIDTSTWDPMLVHILSQKLDSDSYGEYIESIKNPRDLPVLREFIDFLESKFTILESSRKRIEQNVQKQNNQQYQGIQPKKFSPSNYSGQNHKHSNYLKSFHTSTSSTKYNCPLCNMDHAIFYCAKFKEMQCDEKLNTINKHRYCVNCLFDHKNKACFSTKRCRICSSNHNTLLHDAFIKRNKPVTGRNMSHPQKPDENATMTSHVSLDDFSEILLSTALVKVKGADGTQHVLRALIDQGSQISIIKESAAQQLGLKRQYCKGVIFGVGEQQNNSKGKLTINCTSIYNEFTFTANVIIMNSLIKNLPNCSFSKPSWSYIENLKLADPDFNISRPVDMLLGADIYSIIMMGGILKGNNTEQPIAQQTQLGWVLCGSMMKTYQCNVILNNVDEIRKFWEMEDICEDASLSSEDQNCIKFYHDTTTRKADGRYEVRLPIKLDLIHQLGQSKSMAIAQFHNLEYKMNKNPQFANNYKEFMDEYIALNHMKPSNRNSIIEYYLPHHAVQRAEAVTTKLRVVFNASAKSSSGLSLNDCMHTGPNLQQDLQSLILNWRIYKYAWTADIEKMYRQIMVQEQDQDYQKIIWRESPNQPIKTYQLSTVTYGMKAAPFLAMMTLKKLALDEAEKYPLASKNLQGSYYMDDWICGAHDIKTGQKLITDMYLLLKSGGFLLRKWNSNNPSLLENLNQELSDQNNHFNFKTDNMSKTLGLRWLPKQDIFTFNCSVSDKSTNTITKRKLLGEISKIFDPLGWLAPLTTMLKILFQRVWLADLKWDEMVPQSINNEWLKLKSELPQINQFEIPRWIGFQENCVIELHGFSDASQKAYGCVIYAKIKCEEQASIILVAGKAKLVPQKKPLSLPKLELSAAHLLAKLISKILKCLEPYKNIKLYCWCDSKVVLGWLQGDPSRWKPFVANRVRSVSEIVPPNSWDYVSTGDNPADAASRGLSVTQLKNHDLWWKGPQWLETFQDQDLQEKMKYTTVEESKIRNVNFIQKSDPDQSIVNKLLNNHSSFRTVTHIIAWIRRALIPTRQRKAMPNYITLPELRQAKSIIIKTVQMDHFSTDIHQLKENKQLPSKSILKNLNPFIDQEGILRVGGRLANANLHENMKHPAIIPHQSRLTTLLIEQTHQLTFHGGPRLTLANLRRQYWITGGIRAVKGHLKHCVTCKKHNPDMQQQLMGDLPSPRSNPERPFYHTGVDYTGHVYINFSKGRGTKTTKGYIAVFVCLATKAVHLEIVSDMSSSAFLAALRRMVARRGMPHHIYSDQGTNFVGANRLLQENYEDMQQIFNDSFLAEVTEMNIQWHFNAPSWPSAGGLWERAVRSLKFHLKRVVGEQRLTFEEYSTFLCQVEACLNTRPLCALSEDPEDLSILTPAHFLTSCSELTIIENEHDARTRWHLLSKLKQDLWKRWNIEYLSQLSARSKWTNSKENLKIGSLVTIQDENLPPGKWAMGRVIELHPGKDNFVRVVSLKTKNGIIKRPVVKLSVLPLSLGSDVDQITQQQQHKQKNNKKYSFSAIVGAILFFMTLITTSAAQPTISKLPNNQSLYFDPVTKIKIIRDQWNLVVYYNMDPYWSGLEAYTKLSAYLDNTCNSLQKQVNCNMILLQLNHSYQELKYYNKLLLSQHFYEPARRRRRRGLIDGVGNIANSLFGVLDSKFAEKYARDINQIKNNEKYLNKLWQNQTSVVEAEFNLIKRIEDTIEKQHKIIHKQLHRLETTTNVLQSEIANLSVIQDFTLTALSGNNLLQTLKQLQETLLNTITDIYHGHISIHLLTPTQLKTELQVISSQISKDLTLPINNILLNIQEMYRLLHVKTRVTKEYIIFKISIPLVSRDYYQMYTLIPVPRQYNNNMITITPISKYVAFNLQRDSYLIMDNNDLRACSYIEDFHVCPLKQPVERLENDENLCVRAKESLSSKCIAEKKICNNQWMPLNSPSQYFYFCCDIYSVKVVCEDQVSIQQLSGAGIINFKENCIVKGKQFTLQPLLHHSSKILISPNIDAPKLDQINHFIHLSVTEIQEENATDGFLKQTITEVKQQVKNLKSNSEPIDIDTLSYHDVHQYAISYIAVAIAVGIIAFWLYKRRGRRCWLQDVRPRSPREQDIRGALRLSGERPLPPTINVVSSGSVCDVPNIAYQCSESDVREYDRSELNHAYASVSARVFDRLPKLQLSARKKDRATSPIHNKNTSIKTELSQT